MIRALIRIGRTALALTLAGAVVVAQNDPRWYWLAPVLNGGCKYLRDKYGLKYLIF